MCFRPLVSPHQEANNKYGTKRVFSLILLSQLNCIFTRTVSLTFSQSSLSCLSVQIKQTNHINVF